MISSSDDVMAWFVVTPLTFASLWRLKAAITTPRSRNPWWVTTSLAISMATRLSWVGTLLNEATGIAEASTLAKHLTGVFAVAMLLRWVISVVPGRADGADEPNYRRLISNRPRRAVTWIAVALITILFFFANRRPEADVEDGDFIFLQGGHLWGSIHLLLFYTYLTFGLVCAALMCSDAHRRGGRTPAARGFLSISIGCGIGSCYGIIRSAYVLVRLAQRQFIGGPDIVFAVSNLCLVTCILLICFGWVMPTVERIDHALETHAAINDLRPLWQTLTWHTPDLVVPTGLLDRLAFRLRAYRVLSQRIGALSDFWAWRNLDQRLRRRVAEIYDAAHDVQEYLPKDLTEQVDETVRELGLPRQTAPAYLLHAAIVSKSARGERTMGAPEVLRPRDDISANVRDLLPVGTALTNRVVMRRLDRRVLAR